MRIGAEVGHGHASGPPALRLHLDVGRLAAEQAGRGDQGERADVVYRLAVRAGEAVVTAQARQQQLIVQPAQRPHPVANLGGGQGLVGHVEAGHGHPPARGEHDRRRLGVAPDVELGRRGHVPPARRAAHDD